MADAGVRVGLSRELALTLVTQTASARPAWCSPGTGTRPRFATM